MSAGDQRSKHTYRVAQRLGRIDIRHEGLVPTPVSMPWSMICNVIGRGNLPTAFRDLMTPLQCLTNDEG